MAHKLIPRLNAPIVLVHGLCGFDRLYAFRRVVKDYFPGIREELVAAGNRVIFSSYAGTEVKWQGEEYLLMSEEDILAIVEN